MRRTLVANVVGLTPLLLRQAMPRLRKWASDRSVLPVRPDFPAVTCTAQASMLTGRRAGAGGGSAPGHGAVANGWYFRDLAEVWLWRQSCELITAGGRLDTVFDRWRSAHPQSSSAQIFWWWNLPSRADYSVTPRPTYWADGRKGPGIHSHPAGLGQRLQQRLGSFPLFQFWGPGAGIASTRWIVQATLDVLQEERPGLTLSYLPHLDYDLQRYGPDGPEAQAAAAALDEELAPLLAHVAAEELELVVVSEYGIEAVDRWAEPNRALRQHGLLQIHPAANGALLDPGNSAAFAVCDHQIAHVYVRDPALAAEVAALLGALPGVEQVLHGEQLSALGLDHSRSGDLVLVAEAGAWFAYPYWHGSDREPDFARTVEIHRKPGYDPCELFLDPGKSWVKARVLAKLAAKKLGWRSLMNVIPVDPGLVRGSHGRAPQSPHQGPLWIGPAAWAQGAEMTAQNALLKVGADY